MVRRIGSIGLGKMGRACAGIFRPGQTRRQARLDGVLVPSAVVRIRRHRRAPQGRSAFRARRPAPPARP